MKRMKFIAASLMMAATTAIVNGQTPDPNFHIYLCLGQSNMEGNARVEDADRGNVDSRFQVMATYPFSNPERQQGKWYVAEPPLVREYTGLTPMDYFGRAMVANLPSEVRVGVVPVAIGGCKIEHLSKEFCPDSVVNEPGWLQGMMKCYDNYPYGRILACAREAQKQGVIKGILLHQGESNTNDAEWPAKVKRLYDNLISELGLDAASVPLIAGEVVTEEEGGICGSMNKIIATLPEVIPGSRVVSSAGLKQRGDGLHFVAQAYREFGNRYAAEMLDIMGVKNPVTVYPEAAE